MKQAEKERGAAALLALCAMAAVFCLSLSLFAIVDYGRRGSEEFLAETRLRLAAESRVEKMAREIEKNPGVLDTMPSGKWQSYGEVQQEKGVKVKVYLRHLAASAGEEDVFVQAWAEPEEENKHGKGKVVCGYLHRKGDKCDWRGWRGLED